MTDELLSYEPATGALLWRGRRSDIDAEAERAASAQPLWAAHPAAFRNETIRRFANAVRAGEAALADCIARETGKPLWDAHLEVSALLAAVDPAISAASERTGQRRLEGAMGAHHTVRHRPQGVLAVIGPFNAPALAPNAHILPALLAGNAVLFKPSEKTPATGAMLVDFYREAGLPADCLRLVIGEADAGLALARHESVDGVLFTGSTRNGIGLNRALAAYPEKIVALEMGGNNPVLLWDTPDMVAAATLIAQSAFLTSGQRALAARRLIVRDRLMPGIVAELKKIIARLVIDHPHAEPAPFMGPVIDKAAADSLVEGFLALAGLGGRPILHMKRPHGDSPFLTPGLIDATPITARPDEERFGPILQIVQVDDFDAAIRECNATRFGLSATLIGGGPEQYERFWQGMRAGVVNWNRTTDAVSVSAPLGGVGLSGNHRPGGTYAADSCAYPVLSSESEHLRAAIGIGLAPIDTSGMGD